MRTANCYHEPHHRPSQASHSSYDHSKWEEQRKKEEGILRRLAR